MVQDSETPNPVDKGKGKVVDGDAGKSKEAEKDKDSGPLVNGKKDEPIGGGMFEVVERCDGLLTLCSF